MKYIAAAIAIASLTPSQSAWSEEASKSVFLPGAINLYGVGTLYGAAAGVKNISDKGVNGYVAVAGGDATAFGLALTDIAFLGGKLSYLYAQADDATIETHYGRGTNVGNIYEQDLSGNVHRIALSHQLPNPQLTTELSFTRTSVSLDGYAIEDGNDIFINESGLGDIETTSVAAGITWDNRTGPQGLAAGSKVSTSLSFDLGRAGQSNQALFNYQLSHHIAISNSSLLSLYANGSHAFVLSKEDQYDTEEEVIAALDARCDEQSSVQRQNDCFQLEADLATYIATSNREGTAKAVGGSQGLRSYQESFFRGSNSLVEGAEFQWKLPQEMQFTKSANLQWIAFVEEAQIADDFGDLLENSNYSIGTGLRAYVGDIPARLEFAHGKDGNSLILTAGLVF
ncbi:hypothetical protein A9Q99_02140 [Gammaproteobacteria bacterium 45_16_T64]|nr:hypothetical protein A9Q99_02140 [Gammaproteobacteria bacterium 45_16_T64]